MKRRLVIFLVIVLVIPSLILVKNVIFKAALENVIKAVSGLKLSIGAIDIGLIKPIISVKGLRIFNPRDFPDKIMFEAPALYVEYSIGPLFKNEVHIRHMLFNLKELNVIRNKEGELNLNSLNIIKLKKGKGPTKPMPRVKIDSLHLKVGRVYYKDYTQPPFPKIVEFNINIDERYEDIEDPYTLGSLIVARSLYRTSVARLANFDLSILEEGLSDVVAKGTEVVARAQEKVVGVSKDITSEAVKTLKKTKEALKDIISLPIGEDQ